MINFALYNPIDFTEKPVPKHTHEIYSHFEQRFFHQLGYLRIEFLLSHHRDETPVLKAEMLDARTWRHVLYASGNPIATTADGYRVIRFNCDVPKNITGRYFFRVEGSGTFFSNTFTICDQQPVRKFLELKATSMQNRNGVWDSFQPFLHLEFETLETNIRKTDKTVFDMLGGRKLSLDTDSYEVREFHFGGRKGMSRYLGKAVMQWLECEYIWINGEQWRQHADPEMVEVDGVTNVVVKCQMVRDNTSLFVHGNTDFPVEYPVRNPTIWMRDTPIWTREQIWLT
jgi:hypothetical protein